MKIIVLTKEIQTPEQQKSMHSKNKNLILSHITDVSKQGVNPVVQFLGDVGVLDQVGQQKNLPGYGQGPGMDRGPGASERT